MRALDRLVGRMTYKPNGMPRRVLGKDADLWPEFLHHTTMRYLVCSWRAHDRRRRFNGLIYCGRCGTSLGWWR